MNKTATWLLVLLILAAAGHAAHYYPLLPETVASHFGLGGEADGWTSKSSFLTFYVVLIVLLGGLCLGLAIWLPRFPDYLINLPNREYWLTPERRPAALAALTGNLLWLGCATMAFLIAVMHLTFLVNLGERQGLGYEFWVLMGVYNVTILGAVVWMLARFKKPRDAG